MSFEGPIEDRLAIRELVATYGDAVTRVDKDAWAATWAEDSEWTVPAPDFVTINGKDKIVETWVTAMKDFPFLLMIQTAASVKVTGDTATGTAYTDENVKDKAGKPAHWLGKYTDEYVKQNGKWLFKKRKYEILQIKD